MKEMKKKSWVKNTPDTILFEMIQEKTQANHCRPSFLDVLAEQICVISQRSTCLFYDVGAIIFRGDQVLSFGYNGPSKGDEHCYEVGCSRIVNGKIKKGAGLCRGSHGELNAIGNAAKNGINIHRASMMITYRPCFSCSKQIVNQGIQKVYYLFEYDRDNQVKDYLERLGVELIHYRSEIFNFWLNKFKGGK